MKKLKLLIPLAVLPILSSTCLITSCKNSSDDPEVMCTLTFVAGEHGTLSGSDTLQVRSGTKFKDVEGKPTINVVAGGRFTGGNVSEETIITSDISVEAQYIEQQNITITFKTEQPGIDITGSKTLQVEAGLKWNDIKSQAPECWFETGCSFIGGFKDGDSSPISDDDVLDEDISLEAKSTTIYDRSIEIYSYSAGKWYTYQDIYSKTNVIMKYPRDGGTAQQIARKDFTDQIWLGGRITDIDENFLYACTKFNQPLQIPNSVVSIGNGFLGECTSFNHSIQISNSVNSIGNSFLFNCTKFNQPLQIPNSVTSIGNSFLKECYAFNQDLIIPGSVQTIGNAFLENSSAAFKSKLILQEGIKTIGEEFCAGYGRRGVSCDAKIYLCSTITNIGNNFLRNYGTYSEGVNSLYLNTSSLNKNVFGYSKIDNNGDPNFVTEIGALSIEIDGINKSEIMNKYQNGYGSVGGTTFYRNLK